MSLFTVNRYTGDAEALPDSTDSGNHLEALLKKIEERKKRKSLAIQEDVEKASPKVVEPEPVPRKKRRKQKKNDAGDVVEKSDQTVEEKTAKDSRVENESGEPKEKPLKTKPQNFLILGSDSHKKKNVVKRVLPDWLSKPELISSDLNSGPPLAKFQSILDAELLKILEKSGTTKLFPVQACTIPWILECDKHRKSNWWPQDVCVSAPTGSGKTLAYVLPVVQQLQYRLVRKVRCLIVLPVQELAAQVYKITKTYTAHTKLRATLLSGAASFEQEQMNLVKKTASGRYVSRVDIVITTPGRLIDHIKKTAGFSLASLRFLVIDEADKTTDWLQHLPAPHCNPAALNIKNTESYANRPAQKLLFSATLSQDPEKLSRLGLLQPKLFTSVLPEDKDQDLNLDKNTGDFAGRYTSPNELVERAVECEILYKPLALFQILTEIEKPQRTLVFTNSAETAHRLTMLIRSLGKEQGLSVDEISARLASHKREEVLSKFSRGDVQVLISTDALARGMDIAGVKVVVSYDLPKHIKGYIHRSGRTGRAATAGTAVSLLATKQVAAFNRMLNGARKTVPPIEKKDLDAFASLVDYESHIDKVKELLQKEEADALTSLKAVKRKHNHHRRHHEQ